MSDQLNLFTGKRFDPKKGIALRNEALERVTREDFQRIGMETIRALPIGWRGDAQDIRARVAAEPHHFNAWGALVMRARRLGLLTPTGQLTAGRLASTHAHRNPVYERTNESEGE